MSVPRLPASVRVLVRDWLSANNVLLLQPGHNVLVDTGYVSRAHEMLEKLRDPQLDGISIYREYNARYFGLSPQALADWLVQELTRAGALRRSAAFLVSG